jgi:polyisoprenoid-binding protein YceI
VIERVTIPPIGHYTIDPGRSRITFSGRHLFGLAPVRGGFAVNSGWVRVADPITNSSAEAEIDAASFDTGNRQRDNEIRSKRFLNADRYPVIDFTSGHVRESGGRWILEGVLTVHEVAKTIHLEIQRAAATNGTFTARASTRIDRTEFGIDAMVGLSGSTFALVVDITAVRDSP